MGLGHRCRYLRPKGLGYRHRVGMGHRCRYLRPKGLGYRHRVGCCVASRRRRASRPGRHTTCTASSAPPPERPAGDPADERRRLTEGIDAARTAIEQDRETVAARAGKSEAAIFDAHLALLEDEALLEPAQRAIDAGSTAERAWHYAAEQVAERYRALEEPLLRERAADVLDVGRRVVGVLTGEANATSGHEGIVIAGELTPADAAALDPARVTGIATAHGTATAHAAILARALGLPAVVGLGEAVLGIVDGHDRAPRR